MRVGCQCPETLISDSLLKTVFPQIFVIATFSIKSVLQKAGSDLDNLVELFKELKAIAVADSQSFNLTFDHELFKDLPNFQSLSKGLHGRVQNQRVKIISFEVFQRCLKRGPHLSLQVIIGVVGHIVGILTVD